MSIHLDLHFGKDSTALYAWRRLVRLKINLKRGGTMSAGHFIKFKTKKEAELQQAAAIELASLLADVSKNGPVSPYFFSSEAGIKASETLKEEVVKSKRSK